MQHPRDAFGGVDILVNNAGVYDFQDVTETSEEDFERVIGTNLKERSGAASTRFRRYSSGVAARS